MKGNLESSASKFASVMSDFVEEQKNKDLLDVRQASTAYNLVNLAVY